MRRLILTTVALVALTPAVSAKPNTPAENAMFYSAGIIDAMTVCNAYGVDTTLSAKGETKWKGMQAAARAAEEMEAWSDGTDWFFARIDTNRGREAAVCTEAKRSRENIGMFAK